MYKLNNLKIPKEILTERNKRTPYMERLSIECSKTKTKVITQHSGQSRQKKTKQGTNQNATQIHVTTAKRRNTSRTRTSHYWF